MLRKGFTLLELMVSIAIVGLLAAILFPAFVTMRENSYRTTCQSNLKQIGLAFQQYSADWDDILVGGETLGPPSYPGRISYWQDLVYPYIENEQVFVCPVARYEDKTTFGYQKDRRTPDLKHIGLGAYSANKCYTGTQVAPVFPDYRRESPRIGSIEDTVNTVAVADGWPSRNIFNLGLGNFPVPTQQSKIAGYRTHGHFFIENGNAASNGIVARHLQRTNVLFVDGHVKAMTLSQLLTKGNRKYSNQYLLKYFSSWAD